MEVDSQSQAKAIYDEDTTLELRKSHENVELQLLYKEFLGEPLGQMSHKLLHTHYTPRGKFFTRGAK